MLGVVRLRPVSRVDSAHVHGRDLQALALDAGLATSPIRPRRTASGLTRTRVRSITALLLLAGGNGADPGVIEGHPAAGTDPTVAAASSRGPQHLRSQAQPVTRHPSPTRA